MRLKKLEDFAMVGNLVFMTGDAVPLVFEDQQLRVGGSGDLLRRADGYARVAAAADVGCERIDADGIEQVVERRVAGSPLTLRSAVKEADRRSRFVIDAIGDRRDGQAVEALVAGLDRFDQSARRGRVDAGPALAAGIGDDIRRSGRRVP